MKTNLIKSMFLLISLCTVSLLAEDNLLFNAPAWYAATDHFGSVADTGDAFRSEGTINVAFELAIREPSGDWPYVELVCETGDPITGTDSVMVSYKCDTTLVMKLYQTDLGSEGLKSYALYQTALPASKEWKTATVAVSDFIQPSWADEASRAVKLNLDNVARIYFTPDLSAEVGGKATINLKELVLIQK